MNSIASGIDKTPAMILDEAASDLATGGQGVECRLFKADFETLFSFCHPERSEGSTRSDLFHVFA